MSLSIQTQTAWRLGIPNIARVFLYRVGLRTGLHPVVRLQANIGGSSFFEPITPSSSRESETPLVAPRLWDRDATYFGWKTLAVQDRPPDWHANPFVGSRASGSDRPWWQIPDFDPRVGDIKTVWEPSRFDWLLPMAQRARLGDERELGRLNEWLADWCAANPAYFGPNWKCGQEASIRVIHLALAARILGQEQRSQSDLLRLVEAHLQRIYPTISYAMGQDNNHGTSEAAGLFIGGHWSFANGAAVGQRWARAGRRLLENRVRRLIGRDGSFSQYSVNYHRLMLDTLCIVELWRRWHDLESFSPLFYERARAATHWLYSMVNAETGDAPNVGANDGARLLPLVDADYRDYRPTVQLAMALFLDRRAYTKAGLHDAHLHWLGVDLPDEVATDPESVRFDEGGYSLLREAPWFALLRYPRYRFRPGHCDALHLDLWHGTENVLRDGGTYSYNTEPSLEDYFPGTAAHNTVEFDGQDQMPRISRFLRGAWLQAHDVLPVQRDGERVAAGAAYRDWQGATHNRRVEMDAAGLVVTDQVAGFSERAVLRWRLSPGEWHLEAAVGGDSSRIRLVSEFYTLEVLSDVRVVRCELVEGWESRYYLQKTVLPVLEVEVHSGGTLVTTVRRRKG